MAGRDTLKVPSRKLAGSGAGAEYILEERRGMKMMHRWLVAGCCLGLAVASFPAAAELTKSDKQEIKRMLGGKLYMRIDAPCATGRHPYGVYTRPLVEVSPESVNTDGDMEINASWWHADSTYWGISINDPVEMDEWDEDDEENEVEIELEGVGSADGNKTVIKFVQIYSLDDFKAAYERTFSKVPLQDLHDDWSADVKKAIGDRELKNGMTKRQAFYVTGRPERFEKKNEDGKEVEIWSLRQDKGMKMGYFKAKAGESTGLPASIRFEDGVLVNVGGVSGESDSFSLDD
jgi:hypothetical protein